jgi:site-specific DNA-cytosine methylase
MATAASAGSTAPQPGRTSVNLETGLRVAGLFAGIGGIELGLHRAGHRSVLLNEIEPGAQAVLRAQFPGIDLTGDVCDLDHLPGEPTEMS